MRLTEKLQKLCDDQGLDSQRDLSRLSKLPKSSVHRWLRGESRPSMKHALRLARTLGVPLEYLIDDAMEEVPPVLLPDEAYLLKVYRDLRADPAQRLDGAEAVRRLSLPPDRRGDVERPVPQPAVPPTVVPVPGTSVEDVEAEHRRAVNGEMPKKPKPKGIG